MSNNPEAERDLWMTRDVELVTWLDSCGQDPGWHELDEISETLTSRCCSVGFVVREDSACIVVVPTLAVTTGRHDGFGAITIPKGCIVHREKLRRREEVSS